MDQAVIALTDVRIPWRASRRRARRLAPVLLISLWLHLTLLAFILVTVRYDRPKEGLPPPSTVSMLFDGQPDTPSAPTPGDLPVANIPPPTITTTPTPDIPPVEQPTAPLPESPPTPPAPQAEPAPAPLKIPLPPVPPSRTAELPAPPPAVAMVIPPPRPTPALRPPMPPSVLPGPAKPAPSFPTPTNYSLNPTVPKAQTPGPVKSGGRATLDLSVVMRQGDSGTTLGARAGTDWGNELIAWVNRHKYYPRQAIENNEDGEVTVRVVMTPSGHVTSVDLARRSGSQWLDMALESMFRDANLPPAHGETQPFGFTFTMVYILLPAR